MVDRKLLIFCVLLFTTIVFSRPAHKRFFTYLQPDGALIDLQRFGDEYSKGVLSEDGFLLLQDDSGTFYYADAEALISKHQARNKEERSEEDKQFLSRMNSKLIREKFRNRSRLLKDSLTTFSVQPVIQSSVSYKPYPKRSLTIGNKTALVVLVEFQDVSFTVLNPREEYDAYLNQLNYTKFGMNGSVRDYYLDNSGGLFQPSFDVVGPVKLSKKVEAYGANDANGLDIGRMDMVREALTVLSLDMNFHKYDNDFDGQIDFLYVVYAGFGEADSPTYNSNLLWPHAGALWPEFYLGGINFYKYACSNERNSWAYQNGLSSLDGVGSFIHEMNHTLGLPDFYQTNSSMGEAFTLGSWDVMDDGVYNCLYSDPAKFDEVNTSCTPPNLSAFEKESLGWLTLTTILPRNEPYALHSIDRQEAFTLIASEDEYYVLEYRKKKGWDAALPGEGLLIWHIDYEAGSWVEGTVNNDPAHQHVDILEADRILSESSRYNDVFPAGGSVDFLDSFAIWKGGYLPLKIEEIRLQDSVVQFYLYVDSTHQEEVIEDELVFSVNSDGLDFYAVPGECGVFLDLSWNRTGIVAVSPLLKSLGMDVYFDYIDGRVWMEGCFDSALSYGDYPYGIWLEGSPQDSLFGVIHLVEKKPVSALIIKEVSLTQINLVNQFIMVSAPTSGSKILRVYDLQGKVIWRRLFFGASLQVPFSEIKKKGFVFIVLETQSHSLLKKRAFLF